MKVFSLLVLALGGCAHLVSGPQTILEMHQEADWQHGAGETVAASMERNVARISRTIGRQATLDQLGAAGYECQYGEAHADYPEPMAMCTNGFATRACQFDWEVMLTSDPRRPGEVETSETGFTRDCVNAADDWPLPVDSAIGDQLAPDVLPPEEPSGVH